MMRLPLQANCLDQWLAFAILHGIDRISGSPVKLPGDHENPNTSRREIQERNPDLLVASGDAADHAAVAMTCKNASGLAASNLERKILREPWPPIVPYHANSVFRLRERFGSLLFCRPSIRIML